ncbi:MAG: hypothetical protein IKW20_06540 [Bacteroidales bacterium]|nr:hypothetical protein [Bacteroidales bacterium]
MTKLIENKGISIAGSLNALQEGEKLSFPISVLENTIRTTCVRLKNTKGKTFIVNRQSNGTHIVTRIS